MRFLSALFRSFRRSENQADSGKHARSVTDDLCLDPNKVLAPLIARDEWEPDAAIFDTDAGDVDTDQYLFDTAPSIHLLKRQQSEALNAAGESFARLRHVVNRVAAAAPIDAPAYTPSEAKLAANLHDFLFEPEAATIEIHGDVTDLFEEPLADIDVPLLRAAREFDDYQLHHARLAV